MTMTNEEYVKRGGTACPVCGSNNIHAMSTFESDTVEGWRMVSCNDCRSAWNDVYELTGCELLFRKHKDVRPLRSKDE